MEASCFFQYGLDFSLWNIALNRPHRIQSNMNSFQGNENGLVGYWKFNSGTGNLIYDVSGGSNHGNYKWGLLAIT